MAVAFDPAASSFYSEGAYRLSKSRQGNKTTKDMIALWGRWAGDYPIVTLVSVS